MFVLCVQWVRITGDCLFCWYLWRDHHGCDRMVVGFTTTYAVGAYHHWYCEFESRSGRGVQHYVLKFVSDFRQISDFLWFIRFPPPIIDRHDISEICLKAALNTTKQTNKQTDICGIVDHHCLNFLFMGVFFFLKYSIYFQTNR